MLQATTAREDGTARRVWGTATAVAAGVGLVLLGLWLGLRNFVAEVTQPDGMRVRVRCGSAFSDLSGGGGVRDLLLSRGELFGGREGCDPVVGMALVGALASLSIGVLLAAVAAVRYRNRSGRVLGGTDDGPRPFSDVSLPRPSR